MDLRQWKALAWAAVGGAIPAVGDAIISGEVEPKKLLTIFVMSAILSASLYLKNPEPKKKSAEDPPPDPGPQ